jgi:hypothetical protein
MPQSGHRVAKRMDPAIRIRLKGTVRDEQNARRSKRKESMARLQHANPDSARGIVAATPDDQRTWCQP